MAATSSTHKLSSRDIYDRYYRLSSPPDVFLSYNAAQKGFVWPLYQKLSRQPFTTFSDIDHLYILPSLMGAHYVPFILDTACRCQLAVVVLSEKYIVSTWTMRELFSVASSPSVKILPLFFMLSPSDLTDTRNLQRWCQAWRADHSSYNDLCRECEWVETLSKLSEMEGLVRDQLEEPEEAYAERIVSTVCKSIMEPLEIMAQCKGNSSNDSTSESADLNIESLGQAVGKQSFETALNAPQSEDSEQRGISLAVELQRLNMTIFVSYDPHMLEFFFLNEKEMASCIGVGLPNSKVLLNPNDLSISIHEMNEHDWRQQRLDLLTSCTKDKNNWLAMDCMHSIESQNDQLRVTGSGTELEELYGVGFDGTGHLYCHENSSKEEEMLPLLYEIALFVMKEAGGQKQYSSGTSQDSSNSVQEAPGPSHEGNCDKSGEGLVQRLSRRGKPGHNKAKDLQGDGDEDEDTRSTATTIEEDDNPREVLKVTVYPLPKSYFYKPATFIPVKYWEGLDGATIGIEMMFVFRKFSQQRREISIKATSLLQLDTSPDVQDDANTFGWYHNHIRISVGGVKDLEEKRVAILKPDTYKVSCSNSATSYKL